MSSGKTQLKALGFALTVTLCAAGGLSIPAHADNDYNKHGYDRHSDYGDNNQYVGNNDRHDDHGGNDNHNNNGYNNRHNDNGSRDHDRQTIVIDNDDRQVIHTYMQGHHHHHNYCPPGLAKKHNDCLPPGQARRYEIGQRLPSRVTYVAVPYTLRHHLRPAQPGYEYVRVDDDVLLMSKNDRTIIDAVALLSDLAR